MLFVGLYNVVQAADQGSKRADVIVFSFNRPLQLYALLESVHKYIYSINQMYVLYRTTDQAYDKAYKEIQADFPRVKFVKQGRCPRSDFKPLLLQCFYETRAEYILFSVDDDMVKDAVDLNECIHAMENYGGYAFYLRLGTNITRQYGTNGAISIGSYTEVQKDILKFRFQDGQGDWHYPNTLDMALYKKSTIEHGMCTLPYTTPNTLESLWSGMADMSQYGLCFRMSKKFVLPLNIVQQDWWVPNENSYSAEVLFQKWQDGLKMDISQFDRINNDCALMGYIPRFIERSVHL